MRDALAGQLLHSIRRNFIGSLDTRNASKGVFIITSDFTAAARQTAANTSKLITASQRAGAGAADDAP